MSKKTKSNDSTMFQNSKVEEMFNLVKLNDKWVICLGNFRVSAKEFKYPEEADEYISGKPYEILINVSILIQKLTADEKVQNTAEDAQNA